jgi:hypothetical protein
MKNFKFEKTRPKRLLSKDQYIEKKKYNKPGCCTVNNIVYWNELHWVHFVESDFGIFELEVHYCPFCGQKLDAQTPAKKE